MMGHKDKLKNGDEVDAILARHVYCYLKNRPKNVKRVKRAINKRLRKGAKDETVYREDR